MSGDTSQAARVREARHRPEFFAWRLDDESQLKFACAAGTSQDIRNGKTTSCEILIHRNEILVIPALP